MVNNDDPEGDSTDSFYNASIGERVKKQPNPEPVGAEAVDLAPLPDIREIEALMQAFLATAFDKIPGIFPAPIENIDGHSVDEGANFLALADLLKNDSI